MDDMTRSSSTREKMIQTATELFRSKGYNGVGLTELLTVSGAPKGSFYHHFPGGKEQLGEATLHMSGQMIGNLIDACFSAAASEKNAVDRLTMTIAKHFEKSNFIAGCPIASVALDAVPQSDRLTAAAQSVFADWNDRAVHHAIRWGHSEESARDFADRLAIALEGAWMIARVQRSSKAFLLVAKMVA
jgi:TetR/AcrR family transcriptional regulator, lmrAB and yxaGH operons repressor